MKQKFQEIKKLMEQSDLDVAGPEVEPQDKFPRSSNGTGKLQVVKNCNANVTVKQVWMSGDIEHVYREICNNSTNSDETIYRRAVDKRNSSSSEDAQDTSDEMLNIDFSGLNVAPKNTVGVSFVGSEIAWSSHCVRDEPRPSTSRVPQIHDYPQQIDLRRPREPTPEE